MQKSTIKIIVETDRPDTIIKRYKKPPHNCSSYQYYKITEDNLLETIKSHSGRNDIPNPHESAIMDVFDDYLSLIKRGKSFYEVILFNYWTTDSSFAYGRISIEDTAFSKMTLVKDIKAAIDEGTIESVRGSDNGLFILNDSNYKEWVAPKIPASLLNRYRNEKNQFQLICSLIDIEVGTDSFFSFISMVYNKQIGAFSYFSPIDFKLIDSIINGKL